MTHIAHPAAMLQAKINFANSTLHMQSWNQFLGGIKSYLIKELEFQVHYVHPHSIVKQKSYQVWSAIQKRKSDQNHKTKRKKKNWPIYEMLMFMLFQ